MAALDNASKPSQTLHDSQSNIVPTFMPTPIFQDGANPELFREHRVYNMVSILRTHALIRPDGAKQLVNFLSNLPNPCHNFSFYLIYTDFCIITYLQKSNNPFC